MAEIFGENGFFYEYVEGWGQQLPDGMTFVECPGVAVDSNDTVYVLTRGEHPIIVFDKDGTYQRTFGEGWFSKTRTHGLYCAHDDTLLVADDGIHTIQKFGTDGTRLMEIGERGPPVTQVGRRALQPAYLRRHPAQQWRHLHLRRLRQRAHPRLHRRWPVQVLVGQLRHRRGAVHPPAQHRHRRARPGVRRRPGAAPRAGLRRRRQLRHDVE